ITLAGFHSLNTSMFELARGYAREGMPAFVRLQEHEFELEEVGYTATKHQREVGAGYFDAVAETVSGGEASTLALKGSTEEAQFHEELRGQGPGRPVRPQPRRSSQLVKLRPMARTTQPIEFRRIGSLPPYVFATIDSLKLELRRTGEDIIDLGFGNPDIPSHPLVLEKLAVA